MVCAEDERGTGLFIRLSDKDRIPTMEELIAHMGNCRDLFEVLDNFLIDDLHAERVIRYSKDSQARGWGIKYSIKAKYLGDIIAEKDAFTLMMRLSDNQIAKAHENAAPYTKDCLDHYHRTSNGGWIQYRIFNPEHLADAQRILAIRNNS